MICNVCAKKEEIAELENSAGGVSSVLFEKHDFRLNRGTMLEILARRLDFAVCTFIFKWDVSKSHFFFVCMTIEYYLIFYYFLFKIYFLLSDLPKKNNFGVRSFVS